MPDNTPILISAHRNVNGVLVVCVNGVPCGVPIHDDDAKVVINWLASALDDVREALKEPPHA